MTESVPAAQSMRMMPAAPGRCVHCATEHDEGAPHNFWSLFYGMRFKMKYGRDATHADCVAHLSPELQKRYRDILPTFGKSWTEPDGEAIREPYAMAE